MTVELRLICGHVETLDARPCDEEEWPAPRKCAECKKTSRVVEIHTVRTAA